MLAGAQGWICGSEGVYPPGAPVSVTTAETLLARTNKPGPAGDTRSSRCWEHSLVKSLAASPFFNPCVGNASSFYFLTNLASNSTGYYAGTEENPRGNRTDANGEGRGFSEAAGRRIATTVGQHIPEAGGGMVQIQPRN